MKKLTVLIATVVLSLTAVAKSEKHGAYLFTYFTGNDIKQEQVCYALSEDGWNYTPLNEGLPVISSDTIALKKAVRDPHILRGHDGYFYMVLTDMASSQGWSSNRGLILLKSKDLINWEHHTVHFPSKYKGTQYAKVLRVWAPQTIYDEKAGKYMVYYSILSDSTSNFKYDKVCWNYANADFSDLEGEPQILFDNGDAAIDTDIVKDDEGFYHVFFKTENGKEKGIKQYITKDLHNYNVWVEEPGFCQDTKDAVEGAGVFRLHDGTWVLMYDCYMAGHYQFCKSADLKTFKKVQDTKTHGMFTPRHGTVIELTVDETELLKAWSELLVYKRDIKNRSVPTLTLHQLDNRDKMLADIENTLAGPADIKAYKAQIARVKAYFAK